eukprot:jgi/Bigna1/90809/estExt_fgenesh1_pg.C_800016
MQRWMREIARVSKNPFTATTPRFLSTTATGDKGDAFLSASSRGSIAFLSGKWMPHEECRIPLEDPSFRYGYGAFDTLRTFGGKLFRPHAHIKRFQKTLRSVGLPQPYSDKEWSELLQECVDKNRQIREEKWGGDHWVSIRVSPGVGGVPTVVVEAQPIPWAARAPLYRDGVRVSIPSIRRTPPECLPPRAKLHQYMNQILGDMEVKGNDPQAWSVMLDTRGYVAEVLKTARPQYVLEGVARSTVLECAQELGVEAQECDFDVYDVYNAAEAFVSATSLCVLPVCSVNGRKLSAGVPGPISKRLQAAYSNRAGIDLVDQYLQYL